MSDTGGRTATFALGDLTCTVIDDGPLPELDPAAIAPDAPAEELRDLLHDAGQSTAPFHLDVNCLVVDTGTARVLLDCGVGASHAWEGIAERTPLWASAPRGTLVASLRRAGIDPASIDYVAITHAHPDHVCGLRHDDGSLAFPNARLVIGPADLATLAPLPGGTPSTHDELVRFNLEPYLGRTVDPADLASLVPGISAVPTPGHTPGHTTYRVSSAGEAMTVWGDLIHHHVLWLAHPEWPDSMDDDRAQGAAARLRVLHDLAGSGEVVLAAHCPFPGLGRVTRGDRQDSYRWVPEQLG